MKPAIGLLFIFSLGCNNNRQNIFADATTENKKTVDTIVGSKAITNEIAGSAYRNKATGYFIIHGNDTSDYTCIFTESKEGGNVGIDLNIPYSKAAITYKQRLNELKIILPKAAKDFNFDSLTSIGLGRLILSGDLAVDVTKQYRHKFGASNKLENYTIIAQFLKESKLGDDLESLFNPYSMSVDRVSIEKLYFTSRKELFWVSKVETDTANVPEKILDCITWVKLKKK